MGGGRRSALGLVAAAVVGVVVAVLVFRPSGPPASDGAAPQAKAVPTGPPPASRVPGRTAPPTPRSSADPGGRPAATPWPDFPTPTPEEAARWAAEAPIALHGKRDAARWRDLGARLVDAGMPELQPHAESIAMRLERAQAPVPEEEITALVVEEIELLRVIARAGVEPELLALVQSIEMGAHHAIQGAPTPEMIEAERRAQQAAQAGEQQGTTQGAGGD